MLGLEGNLGNFFDKESPRFDGAWDKKSGVSKE